MIIIDDDVYLPVFASASPFVALSSAPARGRIVAERAPRGPDGRLNREYLPDDDDGHDDDHDEDGDEGYVFMMLVAIIKIMIMKKKMMAT